MILISLLSIFIVLAISLLCMAKLFSPFFFIFSAFPFVRLDSVRCGGVLDYSPYALPSSAGRPIPTPRIYLVSIYSACVSLFIRSLSLACLVCVPLSTGYGPRPDTIDDFSCQLLFFTIESFKLSYHPCPTLRPHTVSSFDIIL